MKRGVMVGLGVAVLTAGALVASPRARGASEGSEDKAPNRRVEVVRVSGAASDSVERCVK